MYHINRKKGYEKFRENTLTLKTLFSTSDIRLKAPRFISKSNLEVK